VAYPDSGVDAELLSDVIIVVQYGHSTTVEFFVANVLAAVTRFS